VPQAAAVIRDKTAIVGLGATAYYKRGTSTPQTLEELVGKSILAAVKVRSVHKDAGKQHQFLAKQAASNLQDLLVRQAPPGLSSIDL
jgi:hypothetical protein